MFLILLHVPKVAGSIPTVVRLTFQAWIHTQSDIKNTTKLELSGIHFACSQGFMCVWGKYCEKLGTFRPFFRRGNEEMYILD
jgi:hypothetical protein